MTAREYALLALGFMPYATDQNVRDALADDRKRIAAMENFLNTHAVNSMSDADWPEPMNGSVDTPDCISD